MKPKLPILLALWFAPALTPFSSANVVVNLKDTTDTQETIQDSGNASSAGFSLDNATLNITKDGPDGGIVLNDRTVSVTNGSLLNIRYKAELHAGSHELTDSTLNIDGYLLMSESDDSARGGTMLIRNSKAVVSKSISLKNGAAMTVSDNSDVTSGSNFSLSSSTLHASVLNLNGAGTVFTVGSVTINNYGANTLNSQLNIDGASFVSTGAAGFDGGDIDLKNGASITAGSFASSNSSKLTMTEGTSISTTGGLIVSAYNSSGGLDANGASLTSKQGTITLSYVNKDQFNLVNTALTARNIVINEKSNSTAAEFSSVTMTAQTFTTLGEGNLLVNGTSTARFDSTLITEKSTLTIGRGADVRLGNLSVGGTEYKPYYPDMVAYDAGHLVIDGNTGVTAGDDNIVRNGSSLTILNGGKLVTGSSVADSAEDNYSILVGDGSTLTAETGSTVTLDGSLVVASGGTLWSGETTGTGALSTTTGINGTVTVRDGATIGSFVHDTGDAVITKDDIVTSIKNGFSTGDGVRYLYQIGANVNMGTLNVESNEIIQAGPGADLTIGSIADNGSVRVAGGTVNVSSATTDAPQSVSLGSYNDNAAGNTTSASVQVDSSSLDAATIKADGGNGVFAAASRETTVINSKTTVTAASLRVEDTGTVLVNNGQINATVVAESGTVVKGSGSFNNGLTMNQGSIFVVGNSPGMATLAGTTVMNASEAVFSIDGTRAATASRSGWGSGTYSNLRVESGTFNWMSDTRLTLEMAASYSPAEGTALKFDLMTFVLTDRDGNTGVTSILIGNTDLLATENGTIDGITIAFSDAAAVDGVDLKPWMRDMQLTYATTASADGKYVTVSLQGEAGPVSIPEPATTALGFLSLAGMLLRRRNR